MQYLIFGMIIAGSILMVYNILKYAAFIKNNRKLDRTSNRSALDIVPLLLLIFFLIGYVAVAFSGIADLMFASILLGGSIYVFLMLLVMFRIVDNIRDSEHILAVRYEEIREEINMLTKDALTVFRVNLTTGEIEERGGDSLYAADSASERYDDVMAARGEYILDDALNPETRALFTCDGLLRRYRDGMTSAAGTVLMRRSDGTVTYVRITATMTKMPVTGEIVAFIAETPYNEEIVKETLLEKVLMDEYNRIAFIINGNYKVLISNSGKKSGLLLPDDKEDTYESIYLNYLLPQMSYDKNKNGGRPNPLRLSEIERGLADKDRYDVDAPFTVDGVLRYKHFVFYRVSDKVSFYLMLITDSTKAREESERRSEELSAALEETVRSNEARIRFFSNISHIIRTPMNGILGFTELASHEDDIEKMRSYVTKIGASSHILLARVNDLMEMSLIEGGRLTLDNAPVDIPALLETAASIVSSGPTAAGKDISIVTDASALTDKTAMCDQARLLRIITRLLENAAIFTPEKNKIRLKAAGCGGSYIFSIENKGLNIPEDVMKNIFDSDKWNVNSEAGDISGAGVGMTVAKALIDRMGGTAEISSDSENNVVFTVRFPFERVADKEEKKDSLGSLRLLVVDDNDINREIAELILEGEGHDVELAENGAEAVDKASAGIFDAVLMDIQMPVMNGYEATAAIRALPDPKRASVPIIAMTANAYQEDQNDALNAGMDGYIPKPIDPETIRITLSKVLSGRHS